MSSSNKIKRSCHAFLLLGLFVLAGCGDDPGVGERVVQVPVPKPVDYSKLSDAEIDFVERFNVTAKSIRDFPPKKDKLEKYFYIFKSVSDVKNAKYLLFGEQHNNSASQLWTAGVINELIDTGDVVLFEGSQSRNERSNITENIINDIFAAREFELRKVKYTPTSILKITKNFQSLFDATKEYLTINILNFYKGKGYFWDLQQGSKLHPDLRRRNEELAKTLKWSRKKTPGKVFLIAGARHLPQYEFADYIFRHQHKSEFRRFLASGGSADTLDDAFFNFLRGNAEYGTTVKIFDFLKGKDYAILIPKNMPSAQNIQSYFPTSWTR